MSNKKFQTNQNLIDFFNKYDYTQKEFCKKIDVRTGTFRSWRDHKQELRLSRLQKIMKTFNLTLTIKLE